MCRGEGRGGGRSHNATQCLHGTGRRGAGSAGGSRSTWCCLQKDGTTRSSASSSSTALNVHHTGRTGRTEAPFQGNAHWPAPLRRRRALCVAPTTRPAHAAQDTVSITQAADDTKVVDPSNPPEEASYPMTRHLTFGAEGKVGRKHPTFSSKAPRHKQARAHIHSPSPSGRSPQHGQHSQR